MIISDTNVTCVGGYFSSSLITMIPLNWQGKEPGQGQREAAVQECFGPPIVVPVSRPHEVEKARRDLPIIMMEQEIMEAIYENSIVILCGETGCGKTTQVPQVSMCTHMVHLDMVLSACVN
jgi:HrpA-like RNA helicase